MTPGDRGKLEELRLLATWLVEDSDLPATEAADFAVALDWAIEELEERT